MLTQERHSPRAIVGIQNDIRVAAPRNQPTLHVFLVRSRVEGFHIGRWNESVRIAVDKQHRHCDPADSILRGNVSHGGPKPAFDKTANEP